MTSAMRGEFEEAAELFAHALDINSEHIQALKDSAFVYLMESKFTEASERIKKARALAPEDSEIKSLDRRISIAKKIGQTHEVISRIIKKDNNIS